MKTFDLTEAVTFKARAIAHERNRIAQKVNRVEGKFHPEYTPMEINWQGAIAEVLLAELYPDLELSQPYVVESSNTRESDFIYKEQGIEVKCNRFYRIYRGKRSFFQASSILVVARVEPMESSGASSGIIEKSSL